MAETVQVLTGDEGKDKLPDDFPLYAGPPAVQAVWTEEQIDAINAKVPELMAKMRPAPMADLPADAALFQMQEAAKDLTAKLDEAIVLLKVTRKRLVHYQISTDEIDAYLARVNK